MAQGNFTYSPTTFASDLPPGTKDAGSTLFTHRYVGELIPTETVTTWADTIADASPMVVVSGGTAPTLVGQNGDQFVRTNGAGQGLVFTPVSPDLIRTVAIVCRISTANGVVFAGGGLSVAHDSTRNAAKLTVTGATSPVYTADNTFPLNTWVTIIVSRPSAPATTVTINGNVSGALAGTPTGLITRVAIGKDSSTQWAVDAAEILIALTALDTTAITAVTAAMRAAHPTLLP